MKKDFFIISLFFLLASCTNLKKGEVAIVTGKVNSNTHNRIEIVLYNVPPQARSNTYVTELDGDSEFSFEIPIKGIRFGRISIGNFNYDFCLQPSDRIELDKPLGDTIYYSGEGAEKNNFLFYAEKNGVNESAYYSRLNKRKINPQRFFTEMNRMKEKRIQLLKSYDSKLSDEFINFYKLHSENTLNLMLVMYPNRYKQKNENFVLPKEYEKFTQLSNMIDDSKLSTREYHNMIDYLIRIKAKELGKIDETLKFKDAEHIILFDSLSGQTQAYALLNSIRSDLNFGSRYDTLVVDKFKTLNSDKPSTDEFNRVMDKHVEKQRLIKTPLHPEFANTILLDTMNQELTFSEMMKEHKGKIVYLDLWSTRCRPCVAEMPYSKKLKEKLKDEPIAFVFISVEASDSKKWNEVFKTTLTKENHYVFKNEFRSKMLDFMEINGVPTYMIFDKKGQLLDYNAERPSWGQFTERRLRKLANNE
ncbi:TlpA family protein disulfide reductase [Saccharicrinis fermentans]|uniref:Thiol-disulfide oxidoreductase n=1 Tax=Saccharicrinis fermentans DSM 9555 = JCM 21142 TaxID=869213 RepID=W7YBS6_9BACT|nr:TlpA disulfide reductase family protein [Saccharicrinis fermentans]GAF05892.1 thiol-disulfide oxidoreductase [Saccharicrinis fermentans DSM 9555 = JCM 21142]